MDTKKIKRAIIALVLYFICSNIFIGLSSEIIKIFNVDNVILTNVLLASASFVAVLVVLFVSKVDFKREWHTFIKDYKGNMSVVLKTWGLGVFLMILVNFIINVLIMGEIAPNEAANREIFELLPIYSIINVCICAPLAEETLFRYNLKGIFKDKKKNIIASGILFGLLHVLTTDISLVNCIYAIPYSILGFAFAKMCYDTDTVVSSMVGHAIHNTITLIIIFWGV